MPAKLLYEEALEITRQYSFRILGSDAHLHDRQNRIGRVKSVEAVDAVRGNSAARNFAIWLWIRRARKGDEQEWRQGNGAVSNAHPLNLIERPPAVT